MGRSSIRAVGWYDRTRSRDAPGTRCHWQQWCDHGLVTALSPTTPSLTEDGALEWTHVDRIVRTDGGESNSRLPPPHLGRASDACLDTRGLERELGDFVGTHDQRTLASSTNEPSRRHDDEKRRNRFGIPAT